MATAPAVPHARTGNERGSARQAARGRWRERGKGRLGRGGQGQRWGSSCTAVPARQRDPGPLCEGGMGARCGPQDAVPKMSRARPLVPFSSPESPGTWSVPQWALLAAPWLDLDSRSPGKGRAKWNCETRAWGGMLGSELDDCTPRPQPRWEGGAQINSSPWAFVPRPESTMRGCRRRPRWDPRCVAEVGSRCRCKCGPGSRHGGGGEGGGEKIRSHRPMCSSSSPSESDRLPRLDWEGGGERESRNWATIVVSGIIR